MKEYIYYVYTHTDPRTGELIYVGHGCRGRAWTHGSKKTCLRSQEHLLHLESMTQDGFVATDWTKIVEQGIDKKSACKIEQEMIRILTPTYNKPQGIKILKMTPEIFSLCKELREDGLYYNQIADEVGLSTMTVYRALNGQTKNIGEDYTNG